jgi:transcriptional regulator with XRE-family HTH domain
MIERIKTLISVKNLTSAQFAAEIGVQRSGISHILSGRNKPSLDFILKILEHYPSINESWLLKGDGEMFKVPSSENTLFGEKEQVESIEEQHKVLEENNKEDLMTAKHSMTETNEKLSNSVESGLINEMIDSESESEIIKIIVVYANHSFEIYKPK